MNISQLFFKGREPGKVRAGIFVILGFALLSALTVACRSGDGNGEDGERGGSLPDGYTVRGQISSSIIDTLSGAHVELKQDGQTVKTETTGLDGLYTFEGLETGTYLVEASAARHTTKATAAFTLSGDKNNVDITLDREWATPLQGELVASLHTPWGLAFGPDGDLYITNTVGKKIQKVTPGDTTITDVAGTGDLGSADGPAHSAQFSSPLGLCFAPNGSLYVADQWNYRIRQIAGGEVRTAAGTGSEGTGAGGPVQTTSIGRPSPVTFINGELYFGNTSYRIQKINQSENIETVAGNGHPGFSGDGGPAINAQVSFPVCMAAGPDGSLYFVDVYNYSSSVRKIDSAGIITTVEGSISRAGYASSYGIAVDAAGTVYVTYRHATNPYVAMIRDGNVTELVSGGHGSGNGQLDDPMGIAIGPDGYLYVADYNPSVSGNNRIMRY